MKGLRRAISYSILLTLFSQLTQPSSPSSVAVGTLHHNATRSTRRLLSMTSVTSAHSHYTTIIRPRRSRSPAPIVIKLSRGRSIGLCVGLSVCPVHCGKTADRIRMPFGIIGRTGPRMRQIVGFGDRSTGSGTFGADLGRAIVTNGDFAA